MSMRIICLLFCVILASLNSEETTSITDNIFAYKHTCVKAYKDDKFFEIFRSYPAYSDCVELTSNNLGKDLAKYIIDNYLFLYPKISAFQKNDKYGSPILHPYPYFGWISPTTLRYIAIAGDIITMFTLPNESSIIEIGGGFGGQCFTLSQVVNFNSYSIIDLPEVIPLIGKNLSLQGVKNSQLYSSGDIPTDKKYDLLISNYSFSECNREMQLEYFEKVIKHCKRGYIIFNQITEYFDVNSLTLGEFTSLLLENNIEPTISSEKVPTHPNNVLITWDVTKDID